MPKITEEPNSATGVAAPAAPFLDIRGDPEPAPPSLGELAEGSVQVREYVAKGHVVASLRRLADGRHVLLRQGVDKRKHLYWKYGGAVCFQAKHAQHAASAGAAWCVVGLVDGRVLAAHLDNPGWVVIGAGDFGTQYGLPFDSWQVLGSGMARRAA